MNVHVDPDLAVRKRHLPFDAACNTVEQGLTAQLSVGMGAVCLLPWVLA
jgi:hypothetical protein